MAIQISGTTVIDNSRNVKNIVGLDIPNGTTAQRPTPTAGSFRYNRDASILEFYDGTQWYGVTLSPLVSNPGDTGIFAGGAPSISTIDYITIATTGNATAFGILTSGRGALAACSSSTRGVFAGGGAPVYQNVIDYINIATPGTATDFGDLTVARGYFAGCSSSTRGIFGGGSTPSSPFNSTVIDYITIATTGNATNFGNLSTFGTRSYTASCSSSTRGVFGGGYTPTPAAPSNIIDYITIATTGNATDFGDLTLARRELAACSSSTRGVFGGGLAISPVYSNTLDYITIATTGNATDFGDLTVTRYALAACSSSTRGVFGGGAPAGGNTLDYITIASVGNATDFGDLTVTRTNLASCSSAHGGLA